MYFLSLIKHGTVKETAMALNITPSAISHSINKLESRFGCKLLEKTITGLQLTATGENFYKSIIEPIECINTVIDNISPYDKTKTLNIKMDGIYYHKIHSALPSLSELHPNNIFSVTLENIYNIKEELITGRSDIIFSTVNIDFCDSVIQKHSLPPEKVGILISNDIYKKRNSIANILANEKLIASPPMINHITFKGMLRILKRNNQNLQIMAINEADLIYCVKKKIGFTLCVEDFYTTLKLKSDGLIFIQGPFQNKLFINRKAYFIYNNRYNLSAMVSLID